MRRVSLALLVLVLAGCGMLRMPRFERGATGLSEEDLREEIVDFAGHFHLLVSQAADAIHAANPDPGVRKRTLLWKLQLIPLVQQAALDPNPKEGFASLLTLNAMMRRYLVEGEGRAVFGEQQEIAVGAVLTLDAELQEIGERFLGTEEMARVQQDVETFAASRPIVGRDFTLQALRSTLASVETTGIFQRVVSAPLAPFRALEGVGDSATEIRNFNMTAREFVQSVERLPEQVRWQTELLLYDLEERRSVVAALASLDNLSLSADRASAAVERLPDDVSALLADSSETLARVQALIASARELAGPLQTTSEQLQQASAAWATVLGPREQRPDAEPGRPFDIREWESAVRELGATASQLEQLIGQLRAASDDRVAEAALAPVQAALERVDGATRAWIDLAAWRIAQLLLAALVLALGYRWLALRLR